MHDRHFADRPFFLGVVADARQLFFGHFGISFIIEGNHLAPFVVIARRADEGNDRAGLWIGDIMNQLI